MKFNSANVVRPVKYTNFGDKLAIKVRVQAYNDIYKLWENAYVKKDLELNTGAIFNSFQLQPVLPVRISFRSTNRPRLLLPPIGVDSPLNH